MRVLNAFRRHGRIHVRSWNDGQRVGGCSTPFGVMVGFTPRCSYRSWRAFWCSTPFGVMVGFTDRRCRSILPRPSGAQRLSASWSDSRLFALVDTVEEQRAQRLSASWSDSHHRRLARYRPGHAVLNAFRRHGRIHRHRLVGRAGTIVCAQRLSASWSDSHDWMMEGDPPGQVLNAFRRHGRIHEVSTASTLETPKCSTPFGVMVGFTHRIRPRPPPAHPCSTPFGVMVGFTNFAECSMGLWGGCSTPFGVMVGFT